MITIKRLTIAVLSFCILLGLTACTGRNETVTTTVEESHDHATSLATISFLFTDENTVLRIVDWQAGRSENFPSYLTPQIITINDTDEIFVFEFDSTEQAQSELGDSTDANKMVYVKDTFILMYPGTNQTIIDTLEEHFDEVYWK